MSGAIVVPDLVPRLVVLTDRNQLPPGRDLVGTVRRCVEAGLRWVVVREHDLSPSGRNALVAELAGLAEAAGIDGLTVVSSHHPVAGARGVHLAAHQPCPPDGWWGRSCHTPSEVRAAAAEGASWVTLSPFAVSASKPGYGPPLPLEAFTEYTVPVLALGGVTPRNAAAAREAGAHGVAVMGEVMRADDPGRVVRELLRAVDAGAVDTGAAPTEVA